MAVARRNSKAGGFFIMAGIVLGGAIGIVQGNAMLGVLAGTAMGVIAAVLLWLVDRRG